MADEKPRFVLDLSLSRIGHSIRVEDPLLIDETHVRQAWDVMNAFLMDLLDDMDMEVTDEHYRELFIEICYKLIYHEASILFLLPVWEQNFKERLAKGKRIRKPPRLEDL